MPTDDEWRVAVLRSYAASVTPDEFRDKATAEAVEKVAYYMSGLNFDIELLDDTSDEEPNHTIQLLFDFLAFTEGTFVGQAES